MSNQSLNAQALLRAAAQLIERALIQLDTTNSKCAGCGRTSYADLMQAHIYERFTNIPVRLRGAADQLDGKLEGGLANEHDRVV